MQTAEPLTRAFLAAVPTDAQTQLRSIADLEATLSNLDAQARAAWPEIHLPAEVFLVFVGQRVTPDLASASDLAMLVAKDLYLLCAYLQGDERAVAAMQDRYLASVAETLRRMQVAEPRVQDILQGLHLRMLASHRGECATYNGRGALQGWLRVIAIRHAHALEEHDITERADEDIETAGTAWAEQDAEIAYLKTRYRAELGAALTEAMSGLTSRQRNLLRYYLMEGLNIEQIGALYQVHRATVARWIAAARQQLLDDARRILRDRLQLSDAEFESLVRMVRSQLDVSVRSLLDEGT